MKKINDLVLFGAIALTGTFAFSSCSSSDDATADVNPTYDGESVKTQFAINIGNLGGNTTRMTAKNTQSPTTSTSPAKFLGMTGLQLFAFDAEPKLNVEYTKYISTLGDFSNTEYTADTKEYKLYYNVEIPTGTNNFLFYAKGPQGTDNSGKMAKGVIDAVYAPTSATYTPADIKFSLQKITNTATAPTLSDILDPIANAKLGDAAWSALSTDANTTLDDIFTKFIGSATSSAQGTAFNGSSDAILATVKLLVSNLNSIIESKSEATVTINSKSVKEVDLAQAILWAIPDSASTETGSNDKNKEFSSTGDIAKGTYQITGWASETNYPTNIPDGAVPYAWSCSSNTYTAKYLDTKIDPSAESSSKYLGTNAICYPPSLAYSCNTPVKANDVVPTTWPGSAANWQKDSWTNWEDIVTAYTTAVALKNNINYGVANLKFNVKATTTELEDNTQTKDASGNVNPLIVTLSSTSGAEKYLQLTGILIGGQKQDADWQFVPKADVSDSYTNSEVTIYDDIKSESLKINSTDATNDSYCLALDNLVLSNGSVSTQNNVNVALEFENHTGIDFQGVDGLVADGQKFYLVGVLDLSNKSLSMTDDQKKELYQLRYPYATVTSESAEPTPHVFMQDFTTTANFKFSSLANAYVNIPDLRTTKMVLGLSVNLAWQNGLTFSDVEIGK